MASKPSPVIRLIRYLLLVLALLVSLLFQTWLLGNDAVRFHPDEAYFAAFARNAFVRGHWLLPGELDKPPLALYGQAGFMTLMAAQWDGRVWRVDPVQGEFAARLFGVYSALLMTAVAGRLAASLAPARRYTALAAVFLVGLSPYTIAFGPTAFTDMPMLLAVMLALWLVTAGRVGWAGVCLAVGVAAKQQAVLFLPLVLMLVGWRRSLRLMLTLGIGLGLLGLWDGLRPYPSIFALAAENNAPGSLLIAAPDVWPRMVTGLQYTRYLFGGWAGTLLVLALALWGGQASRLSLGIAGFLVGYALLHWLVPLNIYDRYQLAIMPLWAVLAAVAIGGMRPLLRTGALILLGGLMLPGTFQAASVHPVIGGDKGQHADIHTLAADLNALPFGTVIYDHWLGWELSYYLGGWTEKRRAYYPTPQAMVNDPTIYTVTIEPRYFPVPRDVDFTPWADVLHEAGFTLCLSWQTERFAVYALALNGPPRFCP